MQQAWEVAVAYKLVWVKMLIFTVGPMVTTYLSITQTVDLDVKWTSMGLFARVAFWVGLVWPGLNALQAFIDKSLAHAKDDLDKKRKNGGGHTEFLNRPDTGP